MAGFCNQVGCLPVIRSQGKGVIGTQDCYSAHKRSICPLCFHFITSVNLINGGFEKICPEILLKR